MIYVPAGFTSGYFNKYPTLTTMYSVGLIASYHRLAFLIDTVLVGEVHGFIYLFSVFFFFFFLFLYLDCYFFFLVIHNDYSTYIIVVHPCARSPMS